MSRLRDIKRRTTSIEKIKKITGALEIVALTRLKRTEGLTLNARTYFDKIREVLLGISQNIVYKKHPIFNKNKNASSVGIICITSDKGLCGNFNNSVFQNTLEFAKKHPGKKKLVVIGKKGLSYFSKKSDFEVKHHYVDIWRRDVGSLLNEIVQKLIDEYISGELGELYLVFNKFKLQLLGQANILKLLPMELKMEKTVARDYIYEPDSETVFNELLVEFLSNQIYQGMLESRCAEEMARMIAMKQATESADEMIGSFMLKYHKERQRVITSELLDIVNATR
jgi:F-type H+-transporting ATPase subunit gamma